MSDIKTLSKTLRLPPGGQVSATRYSWQKRGGYAGEAAVRAAEGAAVKINAAALRKLVLEAMGPADRRDAAQLPVDSSSEAFAESIENLAMEVAESIAAGDSVAMDVLMPMFINILNDAVDECILMSEDVETGL